MNRGELQHSHVHRNKGTYNNIQIKKKSKKNEAFKRKKREHYNKKEDEKEIQI